LFCIEPIQSAQSRVEQTASSLQRTQQQPERETTVDKLSMLYEKGLSRRNFLAGAGALGAASVIAGCSDSGTTTTTTPPAIPAKYTDNDILNFALNLEYLEAEFYLYAATGAGLTAADTSGTATGVVGVAGTAGATTGGSASLKLTGLTTAQQNIVNEIAADELAHVRFLRSALGNAAVAKPAIDLTFFAPLAVAAKIPGTTATGATAFSPFVSFDAFLLGAFIFEDVGVTAYSGAAPLISVAGVTGGLLSAAAGILAVEAYHAGYVRTSITGRAINATATTYATIANANLVSALRATLGGGNETSLTLPTANIASSAVVTSPIYASSIVAATTANAIAFARTTDQVHHIVYGSATVGVNKGGFFPNGTNSIFATTTT
jgi:hypothetical protein